MTTKRISIFLLIIFMLGLLSYYYPQLTGNATRTSNQDYPKETAILTRVIDGDTIEALVNGEIWKIRLLGINTPEKNMPHSNDSKNFLKQFENKTIILERDWEDMDKYKRKLRYAFFEDRFLNLEILENGLANSYYYSSLKYKNQILRAEEQARNFNLGIWEKSLEKCAVENCISLKELNSTEEYFIISNKCSFPCSLEGWFVKDSGRNIFYLQSLEAGQEREYDSGNKDIWNNDGDRFFMFDKGGMLVLFEEYS